MDELMNNRIDISVIIPVFNADKYVYDSIKSILEQDFENYELIIVDDGSTDQSLDIIKSFTDRRIKLIENGTNKGLIYSLNLAIKMANGKYIAHMHADDLSLRERLKKQYNYLEAHPKTDILAGFINLINSKGEPTGVWTLDRKSDTPKKIKNEMAFHCCIAHPAVMGKTTVFKKFLYLQSQKNIEDYDIWLRMLAMNVVIDKLNEPILNYRIHNESTTHTIYFGKNVFFKTGICKLKFIAYCINNKKLNGFILKVFLGMTGDFIMSIGKAIKNIFIRPKN